MTIEEAKKTLEKYIACQNRLKSCDDDCDVCDNYVSGREGLEAIKVVCERLQPKKPICIEDRYYTCPSCEENFGWRYEKYPTKLIHYTWLNHCWECGQALDWSETE